jgi:hypothetical protein
VQVAAGRGEGELWFLSCVWLRQEGVGDDVEEGKEGLLLVEKRLRGKGLNGWFQRANKSSRVGGGSLGR